MQLPSKCCSVSSKASAAGVSQMTPFRWDSSLRRRRDGVKAMRDVAILGKRFGISGSKDEHVHSTAQLGFSLYFALLQDAESSLSEVRNLMFIYKHLSSVFPPQLSPLCIHMHKIVIKLPKLASEGQHLVQAPRCCTEQGVLASPRSIQSCCTCAPWRVHKQKWPGRWLQIKIFWLQPLNAPLPMKYLW